MDYKHEYDDDADEVNRRKYLLRFIAALVVVFPVIWLAFNLLMAILHLGGL